MCAASGDPSPSIEWFYNGTMLSNDTEVTILYELVEIGGVTFAQSILEVCGVEGEDSGEYSCTASNSLGEDTATFVSGS